MTKNERKLAIYRASAGAGKTFLLTQSYLFLALQGGVFAFKQILAITFTNKAAQEMKERILLYLKAIAMPEHPLHEKCLEETFGFLSQKKANWSKKELQKKAYLVLEQILEHYESFAVLTIDKFNHQLIRNFGPELKLSEGFSILMDKNETLQKAIDQLLNDFGKKTDPKQELITHLLLSFTKEQLKEEKKLRLQQSLFDFYTQLGGENRFFKEETTINFDFFEKTKNEIKDLLKNTKNEITALLQSLQNITWEEVEGLRKNIVQHILRLLAQDFSKAAPKEWEEENFFLNSFKHNSQSLEINDLLKEFITEKQAFLQAYQPHLLLLENLNKDVFSIFLLQLIEEKIQNIQQQEQFIFIDQFNTLIQSLIQAEPIPFIYERLGEKLQHFLIDEFQDTDQMQWENFLPLLTNSLANGHFNLLVGDVKQAIYRFRGGEADLLLELNEKNENLPLLIKNQIQSFYLETNWRSAVEILEFNNFVFEKMIQKIPSIAPYYQDFLQSPKPNPLRGYVQVELGKPQEEEDNLFYLNKTLDLILEKKNAGFSFGQMALLFRGNQKASEYAQFLSQAGIPVVSSESLLLKKSEKVQILERLLAYGVYPEEEKNLLQLIHLLSEQEKAFNEDFFSILSLPKTERAEKFKTFLEKKTGMDLEELRKNSFFLTHLVTNFCDALKIDRINDPYLQFFLIEIHEFEKKHGFNITGFLTFWEERKHKAALQMQGGEGSAVQILTFHKSKGLEFPIVILPELFFANRKQKDFFWIKNPFASLPFENIFIPNQSSHQPLIPQIMAEEEAASLLDQLNLLYVCLTRAKEELHIFTGEKTAHYLVSNALVAIVQSHPAYDAEKKILKLGESIVKNTQKEVKNTAREDLCYPFQKIPLLPAVLPLEAAAKTGIRWHDLLSRLGNKEDFEVKIKEELTKDPNTAAFWKQIQAALSLPFLSHWLNAKNCKKILNEPEIATKKDKIFVPDKIIFHENQLLILDYKTGQQEKEENLNQHTDQMHNYMQILAEMYPHFSIFGAIWYIEKASVLPLTAIER